MKIEKCYVARIIEKMGAQKFLFGTTVESITMS